MDDNDPILEVEKLSSRYGRVNAVMEIDLHVDEGELVAIVGAIVLARRRAP